MRRVNMLYVADSIITYKASQRAICVRGLGGLAPSLAFATAGVLVVIGGGELMVVVFGTSAMGLQDVGSYTRSHLNCEKRCTGRSTSITASRHKWRLDRSGLVHTALRIFSPACASPGRSLTVTVGRRPVALPCKDAIALESCRFG